MLGYGSIRRSKFGLKPARWVSACAQALESDFDPLEVGLGDAAVRTFPVGRNVRPPGAGREAIVGQADRFVVDEAADGAEVGFQRFPVFVVLGGGSGGEPVEHGLVVVGVPSSTLASAAKRFRDF